MTMYKKYTGTLTPVNDGDHLRDSLALINEGREKIIAFETYTTNMHVRYLIITEVLDPEKQPFNERKFEKKPVEKVSVWSDVGWTTKDGLKR